MNELHKLEGKSFVRETNYQTEQQLYESMINQPKLFSSPQHKALKNIKSSPAPREKNSPKKTFNRQDTNFSRQSSNESPLGLKFQTKKTTVKGA